MWLVLLCGFGLPQARAESCLICAKFHSFLYKIGHQSTNTKIADAELPNAEDLLGLVTQLPPADALWWLLNLESRYVAWIKLPAEQLGVSVPLSSEQQRQVWGSLRLVPAMEAKLIPSVFSDEKPEPDHLRYLCRFAHAANDRGFDAALVEFRIRRTRLKEVFSPAELLWIAAYVQNKVFKEYLCESLIF